MKQKKELFEKFREEPNQWQKWAWIIERKFDEWNIKHKQELTGPDGKDLFNPQSKKKTDKIIDKLFDR